MQSLSPEDVHERLVMRRRRWTAFFGLPFAFAVFSSGFGFAALAHSQLPGTPGIVIAMLSLFAALCIAISVGKSSWDALTEKEPALIVDSRGITDQFHLNAFLPWSDMQSVSVDYGDGHSLTIVLRAGAAVPGRKAVTPSIPRMLRRAFTGGDLRIPLASLSYNHNQLRAVLKHNMKGRAGGRV